MILWYDQPHGKSNFGDELNRLLLPFLGLDIQTTDDSTKAEIVGIGGNLEMLLPSQKTIVMGTGFLQNGPPIPQVNWDIRLLRGKLTAQRLNWDGPIGDPAILAPLLLQNKAVSKKWKLGIIPHVHSAKARAKKVPNDAKYIDLTKDPLIILEEMASCEAIASSSVHGWLVALAMGIPAKRFELDQAPGGNYRWDDVCTGLDLPSPTRNDRFFTADLDNHKERILKIFKKLI